MMGLLMYGLQQLVTMHKYIQLMSCMHACPALKRFIHLMSLHGNIYMDNFIDISYILHGVHAYCTACIDYQE